MGHIDRETSKAFAFFGLLFAIPLIIEFLALCLAAGFAFSSILLFIWSVWG